MKNFSCQKLYFATPTQRICYRLYQSKTVINGRKLVLVHGAGVAGKDTWANIVNYLERWQFVLVPDLRGMGETFSLHEIALLRQSQSESAQAESQLNDDNVELFVEHFNEIAIDQLGYQVADLVKDLQQLCCHLDWQLFDLAGYSLGGLVAMLYKQQNSEKVEQQFLLEPGLLDRKDWHETKSLREVYATSAEHLRGGNVREGVIGFLNAISPHRKNTAASQEMAVKRLAYRHLGFANALDSVNTAIHAIDRNQLVSDQGRVVSLIGGLSVASMHEYHQYLSDTLTCWKYISIQGTDHSLPYQKPRQIARIFNEAIKIE